MIVVAIVGIALGATIETTRLWRLSKRYSHQAMIMGWVVVAYELADSAGRWDNIVRGGGGIRETVGPPSPARLALLQRQEAHFRRLADKYRRAARYPWLAVAPDPPFPK
jgi:hypothetical protein